MKKSLSVICCAALLLTLAGCNKKDTLYDSEGSLQSTGSIGTDVTESSSENSESAAPAPSNVPLQKISELRQDLDNQTAAVKNAEYNNLHITEDFVVKIPDADTLYDLTLTAPAPDFKTYYEKFDKTFDREFGDIYTQEDKEKLYHVTIDDFTAYNSECTLLTNYYDKLMSGEQDYFYEIYVDTEKAYLAMFNFGNGIYGLNHDDMLKRANPDEMPKSAALTYAAKYFDVVKNYLNVDSEDRYAILDAELSVKEAVKTAKKTVSENEYSWGGSLDPDVYQVKVLDIGEGKYGFSFTMTPSYKGVLFDAYESPDDFGMSTYGRDETLNHKYSIYAANAFMMENGKFDLFTGGDSEYYITDTAEHDSVISFEKATQILSEKFGAGMNLSLSRAELLYSAMYPINENDYSVKAAFPVWKFRCHNSVDDFKYVVYVNAINGSVEYYVTDWWEI